MVLTAVGLPALSAGDGPSATTASDGSFTLGGLTPGTTRVLVRKPEEFVMEQRGITRTDLEPIIGSSSRVSEVLNRCRALSLSMIRRLSEELRIPPEILIQPYDLQRVA